MKKEKPGYVYVSIKQVDHKLVNYKHEGCRVDFALCTLIYLIFQPPNRQKTGECYRTRRCQQCLSLGS